MAIEAFGLSLEPDMCRLFIDNHPDVAHIPRMLTFVFFQGISQLTMNFSSA